MMNEIQSIVENYETVSNKFMGIYQFRTHPKKMFRNDFCLYKMLS